MHTKTIFLKNSLATRRFGAEVAKSVSRLSPLPREARVVALFGDLGSGKTTFAQGFARGLRLRGRMTSPTFLIIRRYPTRHAQYRDFFHIDFYRVKRLAELAPLHFSDILKNPRAIVLIEWANRVTRRLPKNVFRIQLRHARTGGRIARATFFSKNLF